MNAMLVWVEGWQQQCCGEPFAVGGTVRWQLAGPGPGGLPVPPLAPAQPDLHVDAVEDHHGTRTVTRVVTGRVDAVRALVVQLAPVPGRPHSVAPVPASGRLRTVYRSDGAEVRDRGFMGYLVTLDPLDEEPPPQDS